MKFLKCLDLLLGTVMIPLLKKKPVGPLDRTTLTILLIRPGGIGDAIFLLPFIRQLRRENPSIQIDLLCEKRNHEVFSSQKDICRQIYCYDRPFSFLGVFKNVYDVIIDTEQWHYLSAITSYLIKHKHNIGFATRPLRAKLFNTCVEYEIDRYETANFAKLFQPLLRNADAIEDIK